MLTKEFEKQLHEHGYKLEKDKNNYEISKEECIPDDDSAVLVEVCAVVSTNIVGAMVTIITQNDTDERLWLQKLFYRYSRTPIEKREPEELNYVHPIKTDKVGYLNLNTDRDLVFLDGKEGTSYIKTKFTKSEIKKLKRRDDLAIDWEKALEKVNDENDD